MDDASSVEVAHRLSYLTTNVDALLEREGLTPDMEVRVEVTTFAKTVRTKR